MSNLPHQRLPQLVQNLEQHFLLFRRQFGERLRHRRVVRRQRRADEIVSWASQPNLETALVFTAQRPLDQPLLFERAQQRTDRILADVLVMTQVARRYAFLVTPLFFDK